MNEPIYFTEEHRQFRDNLRRFIDQEIVPRAAPWEEAGMVPREVMRQMGELGYRGIRYPETYGRPGPGPGNQADRAEGPGPPPRRRVPGPGRGPPREGPPAPAPPPAAPPRRGRHVAWLFGGEPAGAVAVTDPDAGSDVAGIRTRAVRDGDHWVINGSKMFITNGVHGDLYFVGAKTDPTAKGSRGISIFIVEKGTPGFRVGRSLKKSGWLCSDTAELVFENCRIPAANLLGGENKGFYQIMRNFQNERMVIGAQAMGEAARAIEMTVDYVRDRRAFGATLWDKQAIRQRLAMRAAQVEAGRALVYHAAWLDAQGKDCVKEVSMVKALCGELVNKVLYDCQQFHSGFGYMHETTIARMVRDARVEAIGGGATEVMLEEVAKRM